MLRRTVLESHTASSSRNLTGACHHVCPIVAAPHATVAPSCHAFQPSLQRKQAVQRLVALAAKPEEAQFDVDAGAPAPLDADQPQELGPREDDVSAVVTILPVCGGHVGNAVLSATARWMHMHTASNALMPPRSFGSWPSERGAPLPTGHGVPTTTDCPHTGLRAASSTQTDAPPHHSILPCLRFCPTAWQTQLRRLRWPLPRQFSVGIHARRWVRAHVAGAAGLPRCCAARRCMRLGDPPLMCGWKHEAPLLGDLAEAGQCSAVQVAQPLASLFFLPPVRVRCMWLVLNS